MTKAEIQAQIQAARNELKKLPAVATTEAQAWREKELEGKIEHLQEVLVDYFSGSYEP